jgi:hypothetical protein
MDASAAAARAGGCCGSCGPRPAGGHRSRVPARARGSGAGGCGAGGRVAAAHRGPPRAAAGWQAAGPAAAAGWGMSGNRRPILADWRIARVPTRRPRVRAAADGTHQPGAASSTPSAAASHPCLTGCRPSPCLPPSLPPAVRGRLRARPGPQGHHRAHREALRQLRQGWSAVRRRRPAPPDLRPRAGPALRPRRRGVRERPAPPLPLEPGAPPSALPPQLPRCRPVQQQSRGACPPQAGTAGAGLLHRTTQHTHARALTLTPHPSPPGARVQIPTFGFLYVAGYIGYVGREYLNIVKGAPPPARCCCCC